MNQSIKLFLTLLVTGLLVVGCGKDDKAASATGAEAVSAPAVAEVDPTALHEQAMNYRDGKNGVTRDAAKAFELFTKASDAGNRDSMFFLGYMYEYGESVEVDTDKAMMWYTKSAELGCGSAPPAIKALKAKLAKKKK